MKEVVLLLFKPDCVLAGNVGKVLTKVEEQGLELMEMRVLEVDSGMAERLYAPRFSNKDEAVPHVEHLISGPSVACVVRGEGAASILANQFGEEDPKLARRTSWRKKFGRTVVANGVHVSRDVSAAKREIPILFEGWKVDGE